MITIVILNFPFVHFNNVTIVINLKMLSGKENIVKIAVPEKGFEITEWTNRFTGISA